MNILLLYCSISKIEVKATKKGCTSSDGSTLKAYLPRGRKHFLQIDSELWSLGKISILSFIYLGEVPAKGVQSPFCKRIFPKLLPSEIKGSGNFYESQWNYMNTHPPILDHVSDFASGWDKQQMVSCTWVWLLVVVGEMWSGGELLLSEWDWKDVQDWLRSMRLAKTDWGH